MDIETDDFTYLNNKVDALDARISLIEKNITEILLTTRELKALIEMVRIGAKYGTL